MLKKSHELQRPSIVQLAPLYVGSSTNFQGRETSGDGATPDKVIGTSEQNRQI